MKAEPGDGQNESTKVLWLREAERARHEQERKHKALLEEYGVTEQEVEQWWEQDEVSGREAAYGELVDEELCCDLAGKFARESATRTEAKEIGSIRDNYEAIVLGFIRMRSFSVVLRNETDQAPEDFLRKFGNWIGDYASYCIHREEDRYNWTLSGHSVSKELLTALAEEYVRDRHGLMQFLEEVFKRWQKIDQPDSLWRLQLITQQHLGKPKVVAQYVENIGAVSKCTNESHSESLRARIRQYCSRDRRTALKRRKSV